MALPASSTVVLGEASPGQCPEGGLCRSLQQRSIRGRVCGLPACAPRCRPWYSPCHTWACSQCAHNASSTKARYCCYPHKDRPQQHRGVGLADHSPRAPWPPCSADAPHRGTSNTNGWCAMLRVRRKTHKKRMVIRRMIHHDTTCGVLRCKNERTRHKIQGCIALNYPHYNYHRSSKSTRWLVSLVD